MYIEKDLEKIKRFGKVREKENIKFRSFLKWIDMESEEIDAVVSKIYNEVIDGMDCRECANCCNVSKPILDKEDVEQFLESLEIEPEEFMKKYLIDAESDDVNKKYEFNALPCPFLKDNLCSNYTNRPKDCRSYPHLHKKDFTARLWGVIENYSICPIVFNVFEELKYELWTKRKYNI